MAPNADPWRTLGLSPGATLDEIRRAYRRLAKINHPDAAGDSALPRFLAIQAAYEQLAGPGRVRRVGARPAARPTDPGPATDQGEPWRADPNRARASGRADGRRSPGARPGGSGTGPRPAGGTPGSTTAGGPGSARGAGAAGRTSPPGRGSPPGGSDARPDSGAGGGPGSTTGSTGRGRRSSARRGPTTATPGSTSYEGADKEPFEPGWSGATWYGASSGTYWTINPKEYADPRKHGPEYQARARRSRDGWILDGPNGDEPPDDAAAADSVEDRTDPVAPGAPRPAGAPDDEPAHDRPRAAAQGPGSARPSAEHPPTAAGEPSPRPVARPFTSRRPSGGPRPDRRASPGAGGAASASFGGPGIGGSRPADGRGQATDASPRPGDPGRGGPPRGGARSWFEPAGDAQVLRGSLLRRPTTPAGRLAMALIGWPPLGVFASAAIDQSTGCGRYAASCPEVSSPGTWIVQAAIVLLLLALPALAAWSAHGAIAALVVGVPSAIVLSAGGGSNVREQSGPVLLAVLAVAYLLGVAYAVVVGRRPAPT